MAILDFLNIGEANVHQENLDSLLRTMASLVVGFWDQPPFRFNKLEIGNFACLTVLAPPLSYSIRWEYFSGQSGHPSQSVLVSLVIPVHEVTLVSLATICIICTLHDFCFI